MVEPIDIPNIGPKDEGLISIPAIESDPYRPVKGIKAPVISYDGTFIRYMRPMVDDPFWDPKVRSYPQPKYCTHQ